MFKLVLALICALLIAFFAIQNAVAVTVSFLLWRFQTSLVLIILGAAALGAMAVSLLGTLGLIRLKRDAKESKHKIHELELQIERLEKQAKITAEGDVPWQDKMERKNQ